jgi:FKBP-type peptidyl-prolyl cis-trans isomerase 2
MGYIKQNQFDTIEIRYPDNLVKDPEMLDSTDADKLEVAIGQKKTHLNFKKGTAPLAIGDRKTIAVPPEDAFGPTRQELIIELEKKQLPDTVSPAKGQTVRIQQGDGKTLDASIVALKDESVVLDANHPMAGKTLVFDLELVAVSYGS